MSNKTFVLGDSPLHRVNCRHYSLRWRMSCSCVRCPLFSSADCYRRGNWFRLPGPVLSADL